MSLSRTLRTPSHPLLRLLSSSSSAASAEPHDRKLNRIADELLSLTLRERRDYSILFRHKLGLTNWTSAVGATIPSAGPSPAVGDGEEMKQEEEEKTAFDIKLEKFDAASKIKVIKEVRTFTDLGLKEAKEMVEKSPVVLKKGVVKEEAQAIVAKLKEIGATAVLE